MKNMSCIQSLSLGLLLAASIAVSAVAAGKPNIIHIMVDDAGLGDFTSFWEGSPVNSPNLDQLANDGMRFTQAYAGAANCAPSRSTLLTGRHSGHAYMRVNSGSNSIRDADVTIAEVMKENGYATGGYGKWGLGAPGTPGAPEHQGFDDFVGYYDQVHAHFHFPDRLYDSGTPLLIPENNGFTEPETGLVSNSRVHAHSVIFDRMHDFVKTNSQSGTPFYAWGAWTPPHRRSTLNQSAAGPGGYYQQYANNSGWNDFDKIQAGFVTWIDEQVGQLRQTLTDPDGDGDTSDSVAEDTLIILTSDNGGWQSAHNWDRNIETRNGQTVDLRGAKEGYFEGGLRTPMIAYWPGVIAPGTTSDLPTAFYDYLPTFAELAGAQATPQVDGVSFAPTLTGQGVQAQREGLYFEGYAYNPNATPTQVGRIGDWKIIKNGPSVQIYDLASDPSETTNRFNDPTIAEVQAQLLSYVIRNHAPITSQLALNPPNVGTSNATRDGEISLGIRPAQESRDWAVNGTGDAQSFSGDVIKDQQPIDLYLDDLHMAYELQIDVTRVAQESPHVNVTLTGESGFAYYAATINTAALTIGSATPMTVELDYVNLSPSISDLANDLGQSLSLQLSHDGGAGEISVANMLLTGEQPSLTIPLLVGDLSGDDVIDTADWQLFRTYLFSDLSQFTASERQARGDLNFDGLNDEKDFALFKSIFEGIHGVGSFSNLVTQVPEPTSAALQLLSGVAFTMSRKFSQSQVPRDQQ